jgi:predicted DNA-binding protein with PD1-like motif
MIDSLRSSTTGAFWPLRLNPGDDLRGTLEAAACQRDVAAALVLGGIGSLGPARLRLAGQDQPQTFAGDFELLTLSGTLSPDGAHLHVTLADAQGRVVGGHVAAGSVVRTTVEVVLAPLAGWSFRREPDPATGYDELAVGRAAFVAGLDQALAVATAAHATSEPDKGGHPYILHPLRVMLRLTDPDARVVALLHDVVEDTGVTLDDLAALGFPAAVLAGVDAVTRRKGAKEGKEDYFDFVRRAAADPLGRQVKRADLLDNLDESRIPNPGPEDHARFAKYRRALALMDELEREGGDALS